MPDTLGERLAQARREMGVRERRDISRLELAKAAGVDSSMISQYESNAKVPREDTLGRLAAYLRVTPAYLRYGIRAGEPEPPLTSKEVTDFVNADLAAARAYDAERAAERTTPPATSPAPGAATKAVGGTRGKSRGR